MKKRGATIKHKAAAHSRMIVHHVLPKYEMGLKNAAHLFRIGEAGPAQYDDLVDTMDMMRLGIAVYPAQKRDETAEAVAEMSVTTLSAIRARWVETEKISATEDEQQVLDALVTVSFDYWNRRSSALYTEARRQLIEVRKKQHQDYLKETEMNARDKAPALPAIDGIINAAHKALADSKAPLCAEDVAKSINGTKRATKPQIKEAEKQLKELYGLGILESQTRTGGVSFYSLTVAPAQEAKTGNPVVEDDGCGACGDACASNGGDCRVKEESPPVCESVQAGGESQTGQSNQSDDPVLHALGVMTRVASAARDLFHESEEFDFPDGLGRGAPQRLWDALGSEIEAAENDGAPIDDEMPPADPALLASANRMLSDRLEGVAHALRGCGLPDLTEISGAEDLQMATAALSGAYQMAKTKIHDLETERTKSAYEFNDIGEVIAGYMPNLNSSSLIDGIRTMELLIEVQHYQLVEQSRKVINLTASVTNTAELHKQITSLATDVTNTRRAFNDALNEADRMRTELAIERQARGALQEQINAAPAPAPKGYVLKTPKRAMRSFGKEAAAQSAAMSAARAGKTGEVFALVPVGKAVRSAEWRVAEGAAK